MSMNMRMCATMNMKKVTDNCTKRLTKEPIREDTKKKTQPSWRKHKSGRYLHMIHKIYLPTEDAPRDKLVKHAIEEIDILAATCWDSFEHDHIDGGLE